MDMDRRLQIAGECANGRSRLGSVVGICSLVLFSGFLSSLVAQNERTCEKRVGVPHVILDLRGLTVANATQKFGEMR